MSTQPIYHEMNYEKEKQYPVRATHPEHYHFVTITITEENYVFRITSLDLSAPKIYNYNAGNVFLYQLTTQGFNIV